MHPSTSTSRIERLARSAVDPAVDNYVSFNQMYLNPICLKVSDFFLSFFERISDVFVNPKTDEFGKRVKRKIIAHYAWNEPKIYSKFVRKQSISVEEILKAVEEVKFLSKDSFEAKLDNNFCDLLIREWFPHEVETRSEGARNLARGSFCNFLIEQHAKHWQDPNYNPFKENGEPKSNEKLVQEWMAWRARDHKKAP